MRAYRIDDKLNDLHRRMRRLERMTNATVGVSLTGFVITLITVIRILQHGL